MMDLTWLALGVLSFTSGIAIWNISRRHGLNWMSLAGLVLGVFLVLFSIAWGVGAVLEGVPRAGSMGFLLFGLPGIALLTFSLRHAMRKQARMAPAERTVPGRAPEQKPTPAEPPTRAKGAAGLRVGALVPYAAYLSLLVAFIVGATTGGKDYESMVRSKFDDRQVVKVNDSPLVFRLDKVGEGPGEYVLIQEGQGYGGPFVMGVHILEDATVQQIIPLDDKETPAFIKKVRDAGYREQYVGKHVSDDFIVGRDIDAVTGATITTMAAAQAVRRGAHLAAEQKFGLDSTWAKVPWKVGLTEILVLAIFLLAFSKKIIRDAPWKYLYLGASVAIIGFYANASISIGSISGLLMGFLPGIRDHLVWWILVGGTVLTAVVLGRNVYCTGVCPFMWVEFLLSKISGSKMNPSRAVLKRAKITVNFLLWLSLMAIFLSRLPAVGAYEPFAMMFSLEGVGIQWYILPIALIGAFFMSNFWCRFFCPTGRALTMLIKIRKRVLSAIRGRRTVEGTS